MKTLAQLEDEIWEQWNTAVENGETDMDYSDYLDDSLSAIEDMKGDYISDGYSN